MADAAREEQAAAVQGFRSQAAGPTAKREAIDAIRPGRGGVGLGAGGLGAGGLGAGGLGIGRGGSRRGLAFFWGDGMGGCRKRAGGH